MDLEADHQMNFQPRRPNFGMMKGAAPTPGRAAAKPARDHVAEPMAFGLDTLGDLGAGLGGAGTASAPAQMMPHNPWQRANMYAGVMGMSHAPAPL